jgi:predicted XRE-type DNA-binding protein
VNVSTESLKNLMVRAITSKAYALDMTQRDIADLLGTTQPRVSNLFNFQLDKFSLDALYQYMDTMAIKVEISFDGVQQG